MRQVPTTSPHIHEKPLSQKPRSKYQRDRLLADDSANNRQSEYSRKYRAKKRQAQIRSNAIYRADKTYLKAKEKAVRHHLSKGRSVADIVIREGFLCSEVQAIVDRINAEGTR